MKFTASDYCRGECTRKEFIEQYKPIKLEVGKVYRQISDTWAEKHYKIIFVDNKIALGISVFNKISNKFIGDYEMFYVNDGFKHNDIIRPSYRLIEEIVWTKLN